MCLIKVQYKVKASVCTEPKNKIALCCTDLLKEKAPIIDPHKK
jgi:hypothetical protein